MKKLVRVSRAAISPVLAIACVLLLSACASQTSRTAPPETPAEDNRAPWQKGSLSSSEVPAVFIEQWEQAPNSDVCHPLAPVSLGAGEGASVRAANFGGGWGIAYDMEDLRSAFGIAGTGVNAAEPSYNEWPFNRTWPDGGTAGYGPEGGTGPNLLAYLRIPGQTCLYNVWSRLGREHLEFLLEQLRFVEVD